MDKVILTPRLKLVRVDDFSEGSIELEHVHIVRSSPEASIWSLSGASTSVEHTRQICLKGQPVSEHEYDVRKFQTMYTVYKRNDADGSTASNDKHDASSVTGGIGLRKPEQIAIPLADHLTIPEDVVKAQKVLVLELGYAFLPTEWGKGYAPEAIKALVDAFKSARDFWHPPFERIFIEAKIGESNPRSSKAITKGGLKYLGVHEWEGPDTFIGGAMQPPRVLVYGYGPFPALEDH